MNIGLIIWIILGIAATAIGTYTGQKNLKADWAQTPARFGRYEIVARKKGSTTRYHPVAYYNYTIAGTAYSGKDSSLFGASYSTPNEARQLVTTYFPADRLVAYYDRNNPALTDLNPLNRATAWSYIYLPPLIMVIGIGLSLLGPRLKLNELLTKRAS